MPSCRSSSVAIVVATLSWSCRAPTEITIAISTDVPCDKLRGSSVTVGRLGEIETKATTTSSSFCGAEGELGTLVVVPSGGSRDELAVKIVGSVGRDTDSCTPPYGKGCIVARRALNFIPHTMLRIDVPLRAVCDGVACASDETCVNGACVSATIADPSACTTAAGCDEGALAPADGGADAEVDASVDAGFDAEVEASSDAALDVTLDAPPGDASVACLAPGGAVANTLASHGQAIAYVAPYVFLGLSDGPQGVQIVDATDPVTPKPIAVFRTDSGQAMLAPANNDVLGITVAGQYAYLATYLGGLVVIDVSNPAAPSFVGAVALGGESWAIGLRAGRAYVANHAGLTVVDVTNPAFPQKITNLPLAGVPQHLSIDGTRVYVAAETEFHVVDVSSPDVPVRVGGVTTGQLLYQVWSPGNGFAYVVDKSARQIVTVDVSQPAAPVIANTTAPDGPRDFRAVTGTGATVVVGTGTSGSGAVRTYDITTAPKPVLLTEVAASSEVYQVAVSNGYVAGATYTDGTAEMWRLKPTCP